MNCGIEVYFKNLAAGVQQETYLGSSLDKLMKMSNRKVFRATSLQIPQSVSQNTALKSRRQTEW